MATSAIDQSILALMIDTVQIEPLGTRDAAGGEVYGSIGSPVQCLCEGRVHRVITAANEERLASVRVTFATATGVKPGDRLHLPSRFSPSVQRVLAVEQSPADADGDIAAYERASTA